jgi:hypothetical protein
VIELRALVGWNDPEDHAALAAADQLEVAADSRVDPEVVVTGDLCFAVGAETRFGLMGHRLTLRDEEEPRDAELEQLDYEDAVRGLDPFLEGADLVDFEGAGFAVALDPDVVAAGGKPLVGDGAEVVAVGVADFESVGRHGREAIG